MNNKRNYNIQITYTRRELYFKDYKLTISYPNINNFSRKKSLNHKTFYFIFAAEAIFYTIFCILVWIRYSYHFFSEHISISPQQQILIFFLSDLQKILSKNIIRDFITYT